MIILLLSTRACMCERAKLCKVCRGKSDRRNCLDYSPFRLVTLIVLYKRLGVIRD